MNIVKALRMITLIAVLAGINWNCKKDRDRQPTCRIITTTSSVGGETYNFSYNEEGRLTTFIFGSNITSFIYNGSTSIATTRKAGVFVNRKIITVNEFKLATNVRTENDETGTNWSNVAYEYSRDELIKSITTAAFDDTPEFTFYNWSDHNLVSASTGANVSTLEYFKDKASSDGDYLRLSQLVQGYEVFRTRNLVKSIGSGSFITNYSYSFGNDGKISSVSALNSTGDLTSFVYQYQCN